MGTALVLGLGLLLLPKGAAAAQDHTKGNTLVPGRAQQVDSGESSALVRFLTDTFNLQKQFVERSYAQRVGAALRSASLGDVGEIQKVAEALVGKLSEELGKTQIGKKLAELRTKETDPSVSILIDWLAEANLPETGREAAAPADRVAANESPRSVQDVLDTLRKRTDIKSRYECYGLCNTVYKNWNLDDAVCYSACRFRFPFQ